MTKISKQRWMVQSLLRMAEITDDEEKRQYYLEEVEKLMFSQIDVSRLINGNFEKGSVERYIDYVGDLGIIGKTNAEVFSAYNFWCQSEDLEPVKTLSMLSRRLNTFGGYVLKVKSIKDDNGEWKSARYYQRVDE